MNGEGFAEEVTITAGEARQGDMLRTQAATSGQRWLEVKRVQTMGDGSIRLHLEFSEIRLSAGIQLTVLRGSETHRGAWGSRRSQ